LTGGPERFVTVRGCPPITPPPPKARPPAPPRDAALRCKLLTYRGGHSIWVIAYHLLKDGKPYSELGGNYFDRLQSERLTRYNLKCLERNGYKVTLEPSTV
jgi:hypothetical protein